MDSTPGPFRPRSEADWEPYKDVFVQLYITQAKPLREVREVLKDQHNFAPSEKQCKNKIKAWGLSKYIKEEEAQKILEGEISNIGGRYSNLPPEEAKAKAARALKRKRGREKNQQPRDKSHDHSDSSNESADSPPPSPPAYRPTFTPTFPPPLVTQHSNVSVVPFSPSQDAMTPRIDALQVRDPNERFIVNLRKWTHEACVEGHWNDLPSDEHTIGREASRSFSTNLTAGIDLYKEGKPDLAWPYWNRAFTSFKEELLKTWYYETPMRLLFEVARLVHSEHVDLARTLLNAIARWAEQTFEDKTESRYCLFANFGDIQVHDLLDLYKRAARCLIKGIESRMEPDHPLQYEVRLNRALDILWFEPLSDVSDWLKSAIEVDSKLGPHNAYSIYYLLLEAYRLGAKEDYATMSAVCADVGKRLLAPEAENRVDPWRIGLAYRRLGRLLHTKGQQVDCQDPKQRFVEARRNFNHALRFVSTDTKLKASVLIGICHCQLDMAKQVNDPDDVFLWSEMLSQLEQQDHQDVIKWKEELRQLELKVQQSGQIESYASPPMLLPGADGSYQPSKRQRLEVSPSRRGTY